MEEEMIFFLTTNLEIRNLEFRIPQHATPPQSNIVHHHCTANLLNQTAIERVHP